MAIYAQEEGEETPSIVYTKSLQSLIEDAKFIVADAHYTKGQAALQSAIDGIDGQVESLQSNEAVRDAMTVLQEAIDTYVEANDHADTTEKVLNPSFDKDANNSKIHQVVSNLPAGNYMLDVNASVRVDMNYSVESYKPENMPNWMTSCKVFANNDSTDVHPFFYEDEAQGLTQEKMMDMTNIKLGFRIELPKLGGQMPFIDYFHLNFFGNQDPTGIEHAAVSERTAAADNSIYDLQGRKVTRSQMKPGLYIQNGRKFVVK